MRKALFVLTTLCLFGVPALAQQSPTGQSSGGPLRQGSPGQATPAQTGGGGMIATQPGSGSAMAPKSTGRKMMRHKRSKRAMKRSRRQGM